MSSLKANILFAILLSGTLSFPIACACSMSGCGVPPVATPPTSDPPPGTMPPDGGAAPLCISQEDVLNIPPGNATGTAFSGNYMIVSGFRESCHLCPLNDSPETACTEFILEEGGIFPVIQSDGTLTMESGSDRLTGGVNADGSFVTGTIIPVTDDFGEVQGQALVLFSGTFTGDRMLVRATFRTTFNAYPDRQGLADLESTNVVTYARIDD